MVLEQLCTFLTGSMHMFFYNLFSELCICFQSMMRANKHTIYIGKLSSFLDRLGVQLAINDYVLLDNIHNCCVIHISS